MKHLRKLTEIYEILPENTFTICMKQPVDNSYCSGKIFLIITETMLNLVKKEVSLRVLELDVTVAFQPDHMECVRYFSPN
jgi:hypothetical protein